MSATRDRIEAKLIADLAPECTPEWIEVLDESANHSRGQETHFKVTLVSKVFVGVARIARHRRVNAVLAEELSNGVHALALHLYSPAEWSARVQAAPSSPECAHGTAQRTTN